MGRELGGEFRMGSTCATVSDFMSMYGKYNYNIVISLQLIKTNGKKIIISWLQSPSAVIWEPRKIKSDTVSPSICHEVMGPDAMILVF